MNRRPTHRAVSRLAVVTIFAAASLAAPAVWLLRPNLLRSIHSSWRQMLIGVTPIDAIALCVWFLTALAVVYILAACVAMAFARCTHRRSLINLIARSLPPFIRGSMVSAIVLGLTTSSAGAFPQMSGNDADGVAVMHIADDAGSPTSSLAVTTLAPAITAAPTTTAATNTGPSAIAAAPEVGDYTVRRGDNFWSIAARTLGARRAIAPSEAEIAQYWLRLIDANRSRLVDAHNPDLIFTGQLFVLPETKSGNHPARAGSVSVRLPVTGFLGPRM